MKKKLGFFVFAALLAGAALALGLSACSSGGDDNAALLAAVAASGGGTSSGGTTQTDSGTQTGGGGSDSNPTTTTTPSPTWTPTPTPTPTPTKYNITFNANDGSQNPATATQSFTAGTPQNLKTIAELGFKKDGCNFAGWLTSADAAESSYADGASYTANANATLYAKWSAIPVYSVNIPVNESGSVTASPATAIAGTEITLSNTPKAGYKFASYFVTDANDEPVAVVNGKFTMPAKDVTVTATFNAINYNITVVTVENGSVEASLATATVGTEITLTNSPNEGYRFTRYDVRGEDGWAVIVADGKFTMPAQNVTVTAGFYPINYQIYGIKWPIDSRDYGVFSKGCVSGSALSATVGTSVTLAIYSNPGYELATLAVTDSDGTSIVVSGVGNNRTFTMPAKDVYVSYTFVALPPIAYKKIETTTINGTQYDIVTFGSWPQTIKAKSVTVNTSETKEVGGFTYCKGSDGEWYCERRENAFQDWFKYSDGTIVSQWSAQNYKWFKVEPIKWRVLTTNYNGTGKKLLLAENILCSYQYGHGENNYQNSYIREFLNSNDHAAAASDHGRRGFFLKTAFTDDELATIADTIVDNSQRSTNPDANAKEWNDGYNQYASNTPTTDKVFLLSEQEATKSEFGFDVYDACGLGNKRIRQTTDYAKADGAWQDRDYKGGWWWLRSPCHYYAAYASACGIGSDGLAFSYGEVYRGMAGVVPALCLKN